MAKVGLRFECTKQSKNLERYHCIIDDINACPPSPPDFETFPWPSGKSAPKKKEVKAGVSLCKLI